MFLLRAFAWAGLGVLLAGQAIGQEWTRFRGPNGSGLGQAAHVPVRWTEHDYNWKVQLPGVGHGSPVLWGDKIFVTSGNEQTGARIVLCLSTRDGSRLWLKEFPAEPHRKHADNSFASSTPVVDDKHVYVTWASPKDYHVVALNHAGKEIWHVDLGPHRSGHGFGVSPIVHEDLLIVPNDQDGDSFVAALDRNTGKERWRTPRKSRSSWATPCVYQPQGKPAELIFTSYELGITSLDPKTGQVNWQADVFSKGHVESPIGSPIVAGDLVLGVCGWLAVKYEVVAVRPGTSTGEQPKVVYRLDRSAPLCTTPLVKDDLLFLVSDQGIASCADARTGEIYWRERVPGTYYGSPVCIGNHLYCVSREGDVVVLAASKKFALLARNPLGEPSHSTPAIAGGRMYLRTFSHLLSIGGKEQK